MLRELSLNTFTLIQYVITQSALLATAQQLRSTTTPIIIDQTTIIKTTTTTISSSSSSSTSGIPLGYSTIIQPIPANTTNPTTQQDPLQWIDPLIGTALGGHVFAGATLPFGMAKAVADVYGENQGGFASDSNIITGFSHMHDSGTGGSPSLGNFPIWAHASCPEDDYKQCTYLLAQRSAQYYPDSIDARPGYFRIKTENNVTTEMTVSNHTALYRMTFDRPTDGRIFSPLVLLSLSDLPNTRTNGAIDIDPETGRMTGSGTFQPSFGVGSYESFFCLDFSGGAKIRDNGIWFLDRVGKANSWRVVPDGVNAPNMGFPGIQGGGWVRLSGDGGAGPTNPLLVRVGMSFLSTAQACSNAEKEIPTFDFNQTRSVAESAWREKLSVISIDATGVSATLQHTFWSGLYRTMISPQDYTGENPLWKSTEPYYDSFYCIWDSFRGIHQLLTIVDPPTQTRMIRALIDIYRHEGYLPDCRMSLCKGFTQGGSNADTLLVDSYLKGISDGVDWNTAYEAMVKDAEVEPLNWAVEGRGGLASWKTLGYIPSDDFDVDGVGPFTRSISRTVEYAYNDYSIAILANLTGKSADYQKYLARSNNWRNLYNPTQPQPLLSNADFPISNIMGYLQPKLTNGTWSTQDPFLCSPNDNQTSCYLNPSGTETYEGSPSLYTFYVPQDMASLITTLGGPSAFINRLDYYHQNIAYIGDEQAFLPVWQYHYAGRPGLSTSRIHAYIPSAFNSSFNGIPGNDDSGAMGAFPVLSMMGTWPVQGQNVYLLSPPFFPCISIKSRVTGNVAVIKVKNFDAAGKEYFPQGVTLNGVAYSKSWISHDFFLDGGVLEWVVGPSESEWGTREEDLPPSQSTGGFVGKVKR